MQKQYDVYLNDILRSIDKALRYTSGLEYPEFSGNDIVIDAVIRNLEIIGEAVKNLPPDFRKKHGEIEWIKMAGLRDILIHEYSGVDKRIVWDIVKNKLPELKKAIKRITQQEN